MTPSSPHARTGRTERPAIRPYEGIDELSRLVGLTRLQVGGVDIFDSDTTIYLDPDQVAAVGLLLRFAWADDELDKAVSAAGLALSDIDIVVVADPKLLGLRHVVQQASLVEVESAGTLRVVGVGASRPDALLAIFSGYDLAAYFVLNADRSGTALEPRMRGTILGQSEFRIRVEPADAGLEPHPLTDEERKRMHLPRDVMVYVEPQGSDILDAVNLDEAVRLYVDDRLLGLLDKESSEEALAAQRVVLGEALSQLVARAANEVGNLSNLDDFQASIEGGLKAFIRLLVMLVRKTRLKAASGESLEERSAVELLRELKSDPARFQAAMTSYIGLGGSLVHLLVDNGEVDP